MDYIQEGTSSRIVPWKNGIVRKRIKRQSNTLSIKEQIHIHKIAETIIKEFYILTTPHLYYDMAYPGYYLMEEIDVEEPIWLGSCMYDPVIKELQTFWQSMWNHNYAAWDFELYRQPDGRVMIIDFDKFGIRLESSVKMPIQTKFEWFFDHICFPQEFTKEFPHTIMEYFHSSRISYK